MLAWLSKLIFTLFQAPSFDSKSFKYAKVPQKTLSKSEKKALAVKEKDKVRAHN